MRRDVRILLVGDGEQLARSERHVNCLIPFFLLEGVGKSTIVTSLIKESFVAHVSLDYMLLFKPTYNIFRSNTLSRKLQFRQKLLRRTSQPILLTPEVEQTLTSTRLIETDFFFHSCTTRPPPPWIWNSKSACHLCRIFYRQSRIVWSNTNVLATAFSSTRRQCKISFDSGAILGLTLVIQGSCNFGWE